MKTITLTQGKVTQVNDEDYDWLNQWKWYALKDSTNKNKWYVIRAATNPNKKPRQIFIKMHRLILGLTDSKIKGDHIDGNSLNNQRSNLRIATNSQNVINSKYKNSNTTGYIGVYLSHRKKNPYKSSIMKDKKIIRLGSHKTAEEAAKAYDNAAKILHGEFAKFNFK